MNRFSVRGKSIFKAQEKLEFVWGCVGLRLCSGLTAKDFGTLKVLVSCLFWLCGDLDPCQKRKPYSKSVRSGNGGREVPYARHCNTVVPDFHSLREKFLRMPPSEESAISFG